MPEVQDVAGPRIVIHLDGNHVRLQSNVGWGFTAFLCLKAMWTALEKDSHGPSGLDDIIRRVDRRK